MQASTIILTNKTDTSTIQFLVVGTIKLESIDDCVFVLLDSKDDICTSIDLSQLSISS